MKDMSERVGIVTGASSGIGTAIARTFAEAGIKTVLAARSADKLETIAAEINAKGQTALACERLELARRTRLDEAIDSLGGFRLGRTGPIGIEYRYGCRGGQPAAAQRTQEPFRCCARSPMRVGAPTSSRSSPSRRLGALARLPASAWCPSWRIWSAITSATRLVLP